jgi:hypothetical protein
MNKKTIPITRRKNFIDFYKSVKVTSDSLTNLPVRVLDVIHNLEEITGAEHEITIKEWCLRSGKIFVTLNFPKSVIDLSKESNWINETFDNCTISGNTIEIPFTSL